MPSFRSVTPALALGLLTAMSPSAHAAVLCVDPAGGPCSTTIAAAVALAGDADTIDIAPAIYHETITVPEGLDDLVLEADGAIIDGTGLTGPAVVLLGSGTEVNGLTVQNVDGNGIVVGDDAAVVPSGTTFSETRILHVNGAALVLLGADNTRIVGSSFVGAKEDLVRATAGVDNQGSDGLAIEKSVFGHGGDGCLELVGDQAVFVGSKVFACAFDASVYIDGVNARVEGNKITSSDDAAIYVSGSGAIVQKNKITAAGGNSIRIIGDTYSIVGNKAKFSGSIDAYGLLCTGGLIAGNKVSDTGEDNEGINVECADGGGVVVEKNKVARAMDDCYEVYGDSITVTANKATFCGGDSYETGFEINATNSVVTGNSAQGGSESGFEVAANNVTLSGNTATENFGNGFMIQDTVTVILEGNESSGNVGVGFAVYDDSTVTFTDNASSQSVAFCKDDVASVVIDGTGNSFSLAAPPVCPFDR